MSTHWYPFCVSCNESSDYGGGINHGDEQILDAIAEADILKRLFASKLDLNETPKLSGEYGEGSILRFIAAHADHHLAVRNEYGKFRYTPQSEKPNISQQKHFRQLIDSEGLKSDLLEIEPNNPRMHYQIVKNRPMRSAAIATELLEATPMPEARRFTYTTSEPAIVHIYREK